MTRSQLVRAVAGVTGESPRTVRHLGFVLAASRPRDLEPEDLRLAVDCPFCGRPAALPPGPRGLPPSAECGRCDVAFDYPVAEVYAASERAIRAAAVRRAAS